ncbi:MAG TPA: HEAT repeat domain-containing protein [Lacunisphaera sp.]|nr:HEAT repeat domain-containing protein [Lacunisphaera sp.]
MNLSAFPVNSTRSLTIVALLLAAGCTAPPATQPTRATAATATGPRSVEGAFDDDPRPLSAAEQIVNAAGLDAARLAAAQQSLLAILQKPEAPAAERQQAAQQLGLVLLTGDSAGHAAVLDALAPMLRDPALSAYARLALDRVPSAAVDSLYLNALPATSGRTQLGLIDSLGSRGVTAAAPALGALLNNPATAAAATRALGRIGGPAALEALAQAKDRLAPAVLMARLDAAGKTDAATAAKVAGEIYRDPAVPPSQRAAALRQLISADPSGALREIDTALHSSEGALHRVAIEALPSLPVADAGETIATHLGDHNPAIQVALIAALASRNDGSSVPGLIQALDSADAEVRLAAINALGRLPGNVSVAMRLGAIASGKGGEAKAALASLSRLNGPGLDGFFLERARDARIEEPARTVCIQTLASRNQTEAIPFLFGLRETPSAALRLEALDALRIIAKPSDQPALIAWTLGAPNRTESARAVRALITLILRDGTVATRAAPVLGALESGDSAARVTLLPILSRVAGAPALATAARLARQDDEAVAMAATAELARWPDASALPLLIDLATATPKPAIRDAATQGAARFLDDRKNATPAQRSLYARSLLALPLEVASRNAILHVLSLCAGQDALATATRFVSDPATAAAARDAVDAITSNLAGPPLFTASGAGDLTALMTDGQRDTCWLIPNSPGGWLRLDLHNSRPVRTITLDHGGREWDWPDRLAVFVSDDPAKTGDALLEMEGEHLQTVARLPAGTRGRYVWLRQLGNRPNNPWAIAELIVE